MTIALTKDVEEFVEAQVRAGVCLDASTLVNDVLRSLSEHQQRPFAATPELESWLLAAADSPTTPLRKANEFIAEAELQYHWYAERAGWDLADRYLAAIARGVSSSCRHVLFYEVTVGEVIMRRVLHGHRDLPKRLLEPPSSE